MIIYCFKKTITIKQHHLERKPVHRNVATWQTSEVVVDTTRESVAVNIIKKKHRIKMYVTSVVSLGVYTRSLATGVQEQEYFPQEMHKTNL